MKEDNLDSVFRYPPSVSGHRTAFLQMKTPQQFKAIKQDQVEAEFDVLSTALISEKLFYLDNMKMNRYSNIFAFEHSRVKIEKDPHYYLNANYVRSLVDDKIFAIFGQAPVSPFDNMWQCFYEGNVHSVFMVCSFNDPKRGKQSECYWPSENQTAIFSDQNLQVTNVSTKNVFEDLTLRVFSMKGPQGTRQVNHYHLTSWSDLRKPTQEQMESFELLVELCLGLIKENKLIMIHCSAGIGRTGTLGGIVEGIRLLRERNEISIYGIVQNMRKYRYHAIQTFEQYLFLYSYLRSKV